MQFLLNLWLKLIINLFKLKNMNKSELINAMAEKAGLTKVQAKGALEAFVAATEEALKKNDKISLNGSQPCNRQVHQDPCKEGCQIQTRCSFCKNEINFISHH